ncbi:MAG: hypothetical protein ACETVZ_01045 [Phycisphaerae bacterium]
MAPVKEPWYLCFYRELANPPGSCLVLRVSPIVPRWKMEDGRWKMEDGRWTMDDRRGHSGCGVPLLV